MTSEENKRRLRLHFEGPLTRAHTLPSSALVQTLQQLQRVVHLLAMSEEGREVRQRARVTFDIERRFPLVCGVPEEGGYALPLEIGDASHQFFDESSITTVASKANDLIRAVNSGNAGRIRELIPESYFRENILTAFSSMIPSQRSGVVVSIEDYRNQKLLDGGTARERIEQLTLRPEPSLDVTLAYVTGSLIEMKFQERRLRLKLLGSGRALDASYSDDFEPVLLNHPRDLIQVHGNVVYDEGGWPSSISDVDEVLEVDESPMEIISVDFAESVLTPKKPLSFPVTFDEESNTYEIQGDFDILAYAATRPELEAQLYSELIMLWKEYALVDPNLLTTAARSLREKLLDAFEDLKNAS